MLPKDNNGSFTVSLSNKPTDLVNFRDRARYESTWVDQMLTRLALVKRHVDVKSGRFKLYPPHDMNYSAKSTVIASRNMAALMVE
jgi:hypothetical protein